MMPMLQIYPSGKQGEENIIPWWQTASSRLRTFWRKRFGNEMRLLWNSWRLTWPRTFATTPGAPHEYPNALAAVSGCPMIVIPAGVDRLGLPFGLQIIGKRWSDERLLGIAEVVSELTGGFRHPPGY
jgi:Amidase